MQENQEVELKREYTDEIKKSVIAFLNTNDGIIYVGINNDGEVVGVDDTDDTMKKLSSSLKNSIRPDCTQFFNIKTVQMQGKDIVQINIVKGTHRPYYLSEKGMKPTGVFVRVGSSTQQAQEEKIRELVKRDDFDVYEDKISYRQDLTFAYAQDVFSEKQVDFSDTKKQTLGLINNDGFYTNLALLLSDQCEHSIKCAIFEGNTKEVFKDRKEFKGSLFKQISDVLDYLNVYNKTASVIGGKTRIDTREYPETAIREAVLNAVIHRDYAYSGSVFISLYDDRLEIMSLGGLVDGLSKESIMKGLSQTRNKKLADVFYRLEYIEAYGTGIPRIIGNYKGLAAQPQITILDCAFQICMPNKLYAQENNQTSMGLFEIQTNKILNKLKEVDFVDKEIIAEILGVQPDRAYTILEKLASQNVLDISKKGKKKIYSKKN
ncbi:MAG TPA: putative DNA binding domain-containing protein [Candidatus Pelethenecus sp.]|nr:putative DNA binding domain-containing protein [Candidatus Pelethenecus sp.]